MNKIIVNHLDKIFVTNDAATIVRELEVMPTHTHIHTHTSRTSAKLTLLHFFLYAVIKIIHRVALNQLFPVMGI